MKRVIASLLTLVILMTGIVILAPASTVHADTATENFVRRLYQTCYGRNADPSGLNYWVGRLNNKTATGASVAANFIFSKEYKDKNTNNSQFLDTMYRCFFDRAADAGGKTYFLNQLNSGKTRAEVFRSFVNSTEFAKICKTYGILRGEFIVGEDYNRVAKINCYVDRLYRVVLGRESDQSGLSYWTNALLSGRATGASCAANFFFGTEYTNKNKGNTDYLKDLYQAMMGRAADSSGLSYFTQMFSWGHTRGYIFNCFVNSTEFSNICNNYGIVRGSGVAVGATDNQIVNTSVTFHGMRVYKYQVEGYGTVYGYFVDTTTFNSLVQNYRSRRGMSTDFADSDYIRTRAIECTIVFGHDRPNGTRWHQTSQSTYLSEILTQRADNTDAFNSFIASDTHRHIIEVASYSHFTTAAFVRVEMVDGQWVLVAEALVAHSRP